MEGDIVNRVANSALVTFDLEDFYPEGKRIELDISPWLFEGVILREKEFRSHVKNLLLSEFKDAYVALHCTTEAIIPGWAYMLVSLQLVGTAKKVIVGTLNDLETLLFSEIIARMDLTSFKDKPIIIKGCAHKPIPENAFVLLAQKLQPIAKSVMYGEACSSVPLYKK
ncbi:MAG: hypothetical protein CMC14_00280 [Flavobacteriaceae bacterium]|nr:hypothetical protein [Flavobacteriaceae bacterium]